MASLALDIAFTMLKPSRERDVNFRVTGLAGKRTAVCEDHQSNFCCSCNGEKKNLREGILSGGEVAD